MSERTPTHYRVVGKRISHVCDLLAGIGRARAVPEAWRMAEEFQPSQHLAPSGRHESSHPTGEVLIGPRVRQDQSLQTSDSRRDGHQSAISAHVDRLGIHMEGFISVAAIQHDGYGG